MPWVPGARRQVYLSLRAGHDSFRLDEETYPEKRPSPAQCRKEKRLQ